MTNKDIQNLMIFIFAMVALLGVIAVGMEYAKCDHIEIGTVTHTLPLDEK